MGLAALELILANFFFYGTLCHLPLLERVVGRELTVVPARLEGHEVRWAEGESFPLILPAPGKAAEGLLAEGLTAGEVTRLDFYEGGFGYLTREVIVDAGDGRQVPAQVYFPEPGHWRPGAPWRLQDWAADWGDVVTETAADFMALRGRKAPEELKARYGLMMIRAASRLRARAAGQGMLRRTSETGDVVVADRREPYAKFFSVEEYDLSFRRFDGSMSPVVNRAVFITGDAASVLPYDPVRDRVLLIEQFRPGPFARGDANPWSLEAIAGRVDASETPEEAVRREAVEEAGLRIGDLHLIGGYYPTPAGKSEYLYSYVGIAELPDGTAVSGAGVDGEDEDIRTHIVTFDALMELLGSGEVDNAPLLISALWLSAHRAELRAAAR